MFGTTDCTPPRELRPGARIRLEGYLPNKDFMAALMAALVSGLGRIAFVYKKHADAERWYGDVVTRFWDSHFPPEAMYWRAAAHYKAANDHTALRTVAEDLRSNYPSSVGRARRLRDCINNAEVCI